MHDLIVAQMKSVYLEISLLVLLRCPSQVDTCLCCCDVFPSTDIQQIVISVSLYVLPLSLRCWFRTFEALHSSISSVWRVTATLGMPPDLHAMQTHGFQSTHADSHCLLNVSRYLTPYIFMILLIFCVFLAFLKHQSHSKILQLTWICDKSN